MDWVIVAAAVLLLAIGMYVILDGFDLGVGILFPFVPDDADRDRMIATISPVWDGNETWLVLGGVTLFSAFPLAYSVVLPALYAGVMVLLAALVFRGVAFEFRPRAEKRHLWNYAFFFASAIAAFAQGLVLGGFVEGFDVEGGRYIGGTFGWLTPFSLMTGLALVNGYALLGATWLILKTEGPLQEWCFRAARGLLVGMTFFIVLVSIWTPLVQPEIAALWFTLPNLFYLSPIPLVTAWCVWRAWHLLSVRRERGPFPFAIALFLLAYAGLGVSLWPYVVPRHYTIWDAASPPESLAFILVGVLLLLPLVLGYTVHVYRIFRGKVTQHTGYH